MQELNEKKQQEKNKLVAPFEGMLDAESWLTHLEAQSNNEDGKFFENHLVPVEANGIGYCIDERPWLNETDKPKVELKAAFVGGAAGWIVLFMMFGKSLEEATEATQSLYQKLNWGKMEFHIDDEHGHVHEDKLESRNSGCGFLGVATKVTAAIHELLGDRFTQLKAVSVDGEEVIAQARSREDTIVALTGNHKTAGYEAAVVVNFGNKGKTLNRQELYEEKPAFLWDAWATVNDSVLTAFNELAEQDLELDDFFRIQAALHLITGYALNAVSFDDQTKNVVILK